MMGQNGYQGKDSLFAGVESAKDEMQGEILRFIQRFAPKGGAARPQVEECFLYGCCYWFAFVLAERFRCWQAEIVTDYVVNHFAARIGGRVYDITGDVTEGRDWERWADCDDELLRAAIERDCIMF